MSNMKVEEKFNALLERLERQRQTIECLQRNLNSANNLVEQLHAKNTCMCGGDIDKHGYDDGHSPVSMYDYALDNAEKNLRRLQSNLETAHVAIETLQDKLAGALNRIEELKDDRDRIIAMDNKMLKERKERIEELEDRPAHCPTCDGDHL